MSPGGRLRRAGRRVLAVPQVRRRAIALADRMPALRSVGNAVLGPTGKSTKRRTLDIRPGRMFTGEKQGRRLPIVIIVALELQPGDAVRLAERVERAQLTTGTFRPLVVVDTGELGPFRTRGYAVETLMPRTSYERVNPHDAHTEYVYERVRQLSVDYGARAVIPMDRSALDQMPDPVLRLIGAIAR